MCVAGSSAEPVDPYDNPLVMSLRDFVVHPGINDILGNAATMQV